MGVHVAPKDKPKPVVIVGTTTSSSGGDDTTGVRRPSLAETQEGVPAQLLAAMREIVRYAVMTLAALRDPDARYLSWSSMPVNVVHDIQEAYGYSSTWVREFAPTSGDISQMEVVMPWLAWVRREEGETAVRRILAWSMGVALWRLGQREKCSDRTITNRIDRSISAIIRRFASVHIQVEPIEEPFKGVNYSFSYEKPPGPHGGEVQVQKVYVADRGFWHRGRKWNDGRDKFNLD